ncbi:MAG: hypothetical protein IJE51_02065 [Clostridia bacterium]|nr:hypothetical protein [Clostridia bacterium]
MDRDQIITGVFYYDDKLKNENDIKNLKDCNADVVVATSASKEFLDLCQANGIEVIANSNFPLWWGSFGENAGKFKNGGMVKKLEDGDKEIIEHPALWGDYLCDEPQAADFEYLNKVMKKYAKLYPEKLCFANLYPAYGNTAPKGEYDSTAEKLQLHLGSKNYEEHIQNYIDTVENDYICFDSYPFTGPLETYLTNMDIVADACRHDFRDMWVIIQSGAWTEDKILTEAQIRLQCNVAMAYGANMIIHASYSPGWWNEKTSMVDSNGNLNPTYEYVKKINAEIKEFSPTLRNYSAVCAVPAGKINAACPEMRDQLIEQAKRNDYFEGSENITAIRSGSALLAGYFEKFNGDGSAVMLVNVTNPFDEKHVAEVEVDVPEHKLCCVFMDGKETVHLTSDRTIKLSIPTGSAAFVTVRKDRRY